MICFSNVYNCGMGQSLGNLIKFLGPNLYKEYVFERYKDGKFTADKLNLIFVFQRNYDLNLITKNY